MKTITKYGYVLGICSSLVLFGCEREGVTTLEVGKQYPLKAWPDSMYMANLAQHADTVAKVEMKKWKSGGKVLLQRDGHLPADISPEDFEKMFGKAPKKKDAKQPGTSNSKPAAASQGSSESFLDQFAARVEEIRENPGNNSLILRYQVKDEKNIYHVLEKAYGSKSKHLPTILVKYQLKSFNADLNFDNLNSGEVVKLPKIK